MTVKRAWRKPKRPATAYKGLGTLRSRTLLNLIAKIGGRLPRMPNKKKKTTPKKSAKKTTPKRKPRRIKAASKQSLARKKVKFSAKRKRVTSTGLVVETVPFPSGEQREHRDGRAGDLQGLSNPPTANSESVDELLEEGNALEAEAIQGVENALDADQGEVEHEVLADDVPQEYLDKDR